MEIAPTTLLIIAVGAYMFGMITAFMIAMNALARYKK
jgi:hypothetical protein